MLIFGAVQRMEDLLLGEEATSDEDKVSLWCGLGVFVVQRLGAQSPWPDVRELEIGESTKGNGMHMP